MRDEDALCQPLGQVARHRPHLPPHSLSARGHLVIPFLRRPVPNRSVAVMSAVPDGMAALRIEGSGNRPKVIGFAQQGGSSHSEELFTRLAAGVGLAGSRLIALLGHEYYQTVMIEAPNAPADELNWAIRWQLKDYLNFPLDEVVLDYLPVPGGAGRPDSIYVVAAQSSAVRELARHCQSAELALEAIDVAEPSQHYLSRKLAPANQALALLHYDGKIGLLTVSFGEHLMLSRRIEHRGIATGSQIDTVCIEVQRSLDYFDRQFSWIPLAKFLLAPGADSSRLARQLRDYLAVSIDVLDLGQVFDFGIEAALQDVNVQNVAFHLLCASLREMG